MSNEEAARSLIHLYAMFTQHYKPNPDYEIAVAWAVAALAEKEANHET